MTSESPALERLAFWLLVASLGLVQLNLLVAETLFGLSALCWLPLAIRDERRPAAPAFMLPLVAYGAWTLASAAFSFDAQASLIDCKQLVLFLIVPMTIRLARADRATSAINVIIALGAAGALVGVVEYTMLGYHDDLSRRPTGLLSHYMTYSGVIMLVLTAAVARLLFYTGQRVWPAIAVPALAVALAVTLARNAWIGAGLSVSTLAALRQRRLLFALPVLAVLVVVFAPASIRNRAYSIVDLNDPSNRDRLAMLQMGAAMVRDHPFFGVGPDQVKVVYAQYRPPTAVNPTNPHLHNVPVQIAAERGLPALALWLWFIVVAARDLFRQVRRGPAPSIAAAGLGAVVAMLSAGLFEYNFGDSEFLILFLGLISLPFAAAWTAAGARRPTGAAGA
jgi:O-antigen ligase